MIDRLTKSPLALAGVTVLALGIGAGGMWIAERAAPGALSGADQARVEGVVREYVLSHPEIIPEAMDRLKRRETGKLIAANSKAILEPFGSAWAGNPDGDVTVVEYYDYNCGFCRSSLPTIAELIRRDPGVRVVFREFPILSAESGAAARLSLAAADQGKFKAFHDALYAAGPVSAASLDSAAKTAGVDIARAGAMSARADTEIATNTAIAQQLGMTGTPSWIIGDKVVSAALSIDELEKAVKEARDRS